MPEYRLYKDCLSAVLTCKHAIVTIIGSLFDTFWGTRDIWGNHIFTKTHSKDAYKRWELNRIMSDNDENKSYKKKATCETNDMSGIYCT